MTNVALTYAVKCWWWRDYGPNRRQGYFRVDRTGRSVPRYSHGSGQNLPVERSDSRSEGPISSNNWFLLIKWIICSISSIAVTHLQYVRTGRALSLIHISEPTRLLSI